MSFTLSAVTILSLLIAIAMGVVTWRLVREERRRSEARVAALTEELRREAAGDSQYRDMAEPAERYDADPLAPDDGDPVADIALFDPPPESPPGRRLAALGVAAAVVLTVLSVGVLILSRDGGDRAGPGPRTPVELLALEHETQGPLLAISGSVRNPVDAPEAPGLAVVAMAFDETGEMIASRRTEIAASSLQPGAAAPFVVELPADGISRYRISFILDEATVPHLDLRPPAHPLHGNDS